MAILAECPDCHRKQSVRNRNCCGKKDGNTCGKDLVNAKKLKHVRYWIDYRIPGRGQRREPVGYSIEEARDAEGKRRSQKRENRIFDIKPEAKMTFDSLAKWFLKLERVKGMAYYPTLKINLNSFLAEFGNMMVCNLKPADLENYQAKRKNAGYSDSYIDQEVAAARTMINKAFDNDMVGGDTLKVFKKVMKLLATNANARDRIISPADFTLLMQHLPRHAKAFLATAYFTGMRRGEIGKLTWDKVNTKDRTIKLEASDTKTRKPRKIPLCHKLCEILDKIPKEIRDGKLIEHVFLYLGKPLKDIGRSLETACKAAGITYGRFEKNGLTFHDLRHTFNTYMRKAGVQESVIMAITGHARNRMFDRYNTIDDEDLLQAIDQFERFLASVDQNVDQSNENRA
jgi:integrase